MLQNEAVAISAGIVAIVEAIFPVLQIFEVIDWSAEQLATVMLLLGVAAKTIGGWFARSRVWSASSYERDLYSTGEPEMPPA